MNIDIDDLKNDHDKEETLKDSLDHNPVKLAIQSLYSKELSGTNYKKLSLNNVKLLVTTSLKEANKPGPTYSKALRLIRKIEKAADTNTILFALEDFLFS